MKRTNLTLWFLLLLQALAILAIAGEASGVFGPLGRLIVGSIPLPEPGENPGVLIGLARFVIAYWFFGSLVLSAIGSLLAVVFVAFDRSQPKFERLAWAIGFLLGQWVTVTLFCVLRLRSAWRTDHNVAAN